MFMHIKSILYYRDNNRKAKMKAKVLFWLTVGVTVSQKQIQTKFNFEEDYYDYSVTPRFPERPAPKRLHIRDKNFCRRF